MFKTERGRSTAFRTMFKKSNFSTGTGQASLRRSSEDGGCGDIWSLRLYESSDHPLSPEYRKLPRRKYIQNSKTEGSAKCFSDFVCCKMHFIKRARQSRWHGLSWYLVCVGLSWEDSREKGTWFILVRPVFVQNIQRHLTSLLPYYSESIWLTVKDCYFRPLSQFEDRPFIFLFTDWLRSQDSKTFICWDEAGGSAGSAHVASVSLIFRATDRPSHHCPLIPWQKDDDDDDGDDDYKGETCDRISLCPVIPWQKKMMMVVMMIIRVKPVTEYPSAQ